MNDGGPAFPLGYSTKPQDNPGMSLRDYFAAKAMHAFLSAAFSSQEACAAFEEQFKADGLDTSSGHSKAAYQIADAMLAERTKEQSK